MIEIITKNLDLTVTQNLVKTNKVEIAPNFNRFSFTRQLYSVNSTFLVTMLLCVSAIYKVTCENILKSIKRPVIIHLKNLKIVSIYINKTTKTRFTLYKKFGKNKKIKDNLLFFQTTAFYKVTNISIISLICATNYRYISLVMQFCF